MSMDISVGAANIRVSDEEAQMIYKQIKARAAKAELESRNYFVDSIPQDFDYLRELCNHDFTTVPKKFKDKRCESYTQEYLDWCHAMDVLYKISIYVFDIYYHMRTTPYPMSYTVTYALEEYMKKWSEYKHRNDALIEQLCEMARNQPNWNQTNSN